MIILIILKILMITHTLLIDNLYQALNSNVLSNTKLLLRINDGEVYMPLIKVYLIGLHLR